MDFVEAKAIAMVYTISSTFEKAYDCVLSQEVKDAHKNGMSLIDHSLELKRNIMLSQGLSLPDQELDKMQLYENGDGSGFVLRFKARINTDGWKMRMIGSI